MTFPYHAQTVLLTGASSGIGRSFATALAARRADLVLVARRADRLESLAAELRERYGVTVHAIPLDLATPSAGTDLRDAAAQRGIRVTSLINNAGFASYGRFAEQDPDRLAREIAVNVSAPVQLTAAFLPQIRAAGDGFIINVASMAAYAPSPRMAVYSASKTFVLTFTEALWPQFRGTGVTVFAISPGATSTEFNEVAGSDDATAGVRMRSPEAVVETALAHLERRDPGPSVIDGRGNRLSVNVVRVLTRRATVSLMERFTDPRRGDRRRARAAK